jgi:hypothetical protein
LRKNRFVARSRMPAAQLIGIGLPEFPTPIPHGLVSERDATFGPQLFDLPRAEAAAAVEPDTVANDLGWEAMTCVGTGSRLYGHRASMPHKAGAEKGAHFM